MLYQNHMVAARFIDRHSPPPPTSDDVKNDSHPCGCQKTSGLFHRRGEGRRADVGSRPVGPRRRPSRAHGRQNDNKYPASLEVRTIDAEDTGDRGVQVTSLTLTARTDI